MTNRINRMLQRTINRMNDGEVQSIIDADLKSVHSLTFGEKRIKLIKVLKDR